MNLDRIEAILRLLYRQPHVGEIEAEGDGWTLRARKSPEVAAALAAVPPEPEPPVEAEPERFSVRATMVGVYRVSGRPLHAGDFVPEGGAVGSIDSLHILNPVEAARGGYVQAAMVEDGDPVEYGQELFVLGPEPPGLPHES